MPLIRYSNAALGQQVKTFGIGELRRPRLEGSFTTEVRGTTENQSARCNAGAFHLPSSADGLGQ
jgi:hypothetical protein